VQGATGYLLYDYETKGDVQAVSAPFASWVGSGGTEVIVKVCPKCGYQETVRFCVACHQTISTSHKWRRVVGGLQHWSCTNPKSYEGRPRTWERDRLLRLRSPAYPEIAC
jgi:hypothetical protein